MFRPKRNKLAVLEGKLLVYRRDPMFGREGWCLAGSLIANMQTMGWVHRLIKQKAEPGQVGRVVDGKFEIKGD